LLPKTLPQFTVGRDKYSACGAQHRFVVGQYPRITESKTSAGGTTDIGIRVEASFNVVVEIHNLVYRHSVLDSVGDAVAGLVGIDGGVVSGVINLESSGVEAPDWRPRHDEHYHEA
jgi:hypothetical protein